MIENNKQLATTLDYVAKWVDALESMRLHEAEAVGGVFPTLAAGPIREIRKNLEIAQAYAHSELQKPASLTTTEVKRTAKAS